MLQLLFVSIRFVLLIGEWYLQMITFLPLLFLSSQTLFKSHLFLNINGVKWKSCGIVTFLKIFIYTVHQFFWILHFCHTCNLCRVELVVQFPARGLTQVLLCLLPGVLWLWPFLYSVGPHPLSSLHIYTFVVLWTFMAGAASQAGDAYSPGNLVSPLVWRGPWMSTAVLY